MPSRSKWKNQFQKIPGNSKFHNQLREIFTKDPFFSKLRCFQEVPVQDLCPEYPHKSHRFDWYIEELDTIIELHGEQHFKFSNRGNIAYDAAKDSFVKGRIRDDEKKLSAEEEGYDFIMIPYKDRGKLTAEYIKALLFED